MGIRPQVKKVGTKILISSIWPKILNPIGFNSNIESKKADKRVYFLISILL